MFIIVVLFEQIRQARRAGHDGGEHVQDGRDALWRDTKGTSTKYLGQKFHREEAV